MSDIMLTKFAVKNYRGFAEKIEWDLSHPSSYAFNTNAIKDGVIKNGIVYGPNGAGKTNLGLAIFDIANHLSHKWKKPDYYVNFVNAANHLNPVEFEYTFAFDGNVVNYNYSKRAKEFQGELVSETLLLNGKELVYKDADTLRVAEEFALSDAAINSLKASANKISIINYLVATVPLAEGHAILQLKNFVENMLFFRSLDYREFIGLKEGGSNIEEYIINNNLTDDFATYLRETSLQDFTFAQPAEGDKVLYCLIDGVKILFSLVASTGTLDLELQYYWLKEMANASFVFVDEFDAFYHYELSYTVCKLLFKGDHQAFVTTHDTFLLTNDLLRPDCFFILKNNKINAICDLTDKELRFGHNLEKLYRGGTFGV